MKWKWRLLLPNEFIYLYNFIKGILFGNHLPNWDEDVNEDRQEKWLEQTKWEKNRNKTVGLWMRWINWNLCKFSNSDMSSSQMFAKKNLNIARS